MMKNLKRNWLVSSKLTSGIWQIVTWALVNLKNLHFNGLLLTKVYNVWAKKVQRSYVWWHWRLMQNLKENWLAPSKNFCLQAENSDFILESKMAELNWKQNLLIYFENCQMFPILMSRNRLMNTFMIVFPYRQIIDRNLNILLMVNINPIKKIV